MKTPILTGTTASGKTAVALQLARERGDVEIVNADSMLVYRGMNIGTAKPSRAELEEIPHHLIDIRNPDDAFTAGDFVREATKAIRLIKEKGKKPLIVGGTGFYLKALIFGMWEAAPSDPAYRAELEKETNERLFDRLAMLDSAAADRIGRGDRYRLIRANEIIHTTGQTPSQLRMAEKPEPNPEFELFWIDRDTPELYRRIHERTFEMLRNGLLEEVRSLQALAPGARALSAVGYAQVRDFLAGKVPEGRKIRSGVAGLQDEIELATRQLVKRQRTWFRGQIGANPYILERDLPALLDLLRAGFSVANEQGKK